MKTAATFLGSLEALAALLWSIGVRDLLSYGLESDVTALLETVPHPWITSKNGSSRRVSVPNPTSPVNGRSLISGTGGWELKSNVAAPQTASALHMSRPFRRLSLRLRPPATRLMPDAATSLFHGGSFVILDRRS